MYLSLSLISPIFLTCLRSGENGAEAPAAAASNYVGVYRAVDLGDAEHQRQSQDAHVANLVTPWSLTGHSLVTHTSLDGRRSRHIQTQHLSKRNFPLTLSFSSGFRLRRETAAASRRGKGPRGRRKMYGPARGRIQQGFVEGAFEKSTALPNH